jgi:mono/diheme cytochrome c family protein
MKSNNRKAKNHWVFNLTMAAILMCVSSCYYEDVAPVEVVIPDDPINYVLDVQPFFDANCIACHGGSISPNLSASVSYEELISGNWINTTAPESSRLYVSIDMGGNMEAYATPAERAIILAWIEQGASGN